jgi:hypothetical protein
LPDTIVYETISTVGPKCFGKVLASAVVLIVIDERKLRSAPAEIVQIGVEVD